MAKQQSINDKQHDQAAKDGVLDKTIVEPSPDDKLLSERLKTNPPVPAPDLRPVDRDLLKKIDVVPTAIELKHSSAREQSKEPYLQNLAPASKEEQQMLDLAYKALKHTPGHGLDNQKPVFTGTEDVPGIPPMYTDDADAFAPGNRSSVKATEVLKQLKTVDEFKNFMQELKREFKQANGRELTEQDLKLLNPLSDRERQDLAQVQSKTEAFRNAQKDAEAKGFRFPSKTDVLYMDKYTEEQKQNLEELAVKREGHLVVGMLSAFIKDKPGVEDYAKMASYALVREWENHGEAHYYKSPLLSEIYKNAENNLIATELESFEQKTTNFARAVAIHVALDQRAMHGLLWHSPDPIKIRSLLAPLDAENRKQVVDSLMELTLGGLQEDVNKRLKRDPMELFAIKELLNRPGEIDAPSQVMVGMKFLQRRLGIEQNDSVSGIEWLGIKSGETGVLKRAALLDADGWKKLNELYAKDTNESKGRTESLADFSKIQGMPKAFAASFEALRAANGSPNGYETVKKMIDSASAERRYDLVTLALQIADADARNKMMHDGKQNANGKSTMDNTLDVFRQSLPLGPLKDVPLVQNIAKFVRKDNRAETIKEFFEDGEVSLLTKVKGYTGGLFHLNRLPYTRDHELQLLSSDTDGIKAFFSSASEKQKDKVINDESYRSNLREALLKAMSAREADILLSDLQGKENLSSALLNLRPPGWLPRKLDSDKPKAADSGSLQHTGDLGYKRYLEEHLTEKDRQFWSKNINNPKEQSRLERDLSSVYSKTEISEIVSSLKDKFKNPDISLQEISRSGLGNRSLDKELTDAKVPADLVRAIFKINESTRKDLVAAGANLSPADKASKDAIAVKIESLVKAKASEIAPTKEQAQALTNFCLEQINKVKAGGTDLTTPREMQLDAIAQVRLAAAVNMKDPFIALTAIQNAFQEIPHLKERLEKEPQLKSDFEQALRMAIHQGNLDTAFDKGARRLDGDSIWREGYSVATNTVNTATALAGLRTGTFKQFEHVLKGEPLKIDELVQFAGTWPAKRDVVFKYATPDEVANLKQKTSDPKLMAWQEKVMGPTQHREVTQNCLAKGYCDAADQARIASLGRQKFAIDSVDAPMFSEAYVRNLFLGVQRKVGPTLLGDIPVDPAIKAFQGLNRTEVQHAVESGMSRYQSLVTQDVVEKSPIFEKLNAQLASSQFEVGPLESVLAAFAKRDSARAPRWQIATDYLLGGKAGIGVEDANNALVKSKALLDAMAELKKTGFTDQLKEIAENSNPETARQIRQALSDFEKSMQTYNKAEEGIADRVKALTDLLNIGTVVLTWGGSVVPIYGRLLGGAEMADSFFIGKVTAKAQMALSYWLTSSALRENMDVGATLRALVLFPLLQAKLPILGNWAAGKVLGIPAGPLSHNIVYKVLHYGLDYGVKGAVVIGTPAVLAYDPVFTPGSDEVSRLNQTDKLPEKRNAALREQLQYEMMMRLVDLKD